MTDRAAWLIERHIANVLHYYSADAMWPKARCDAADWRPDVDLAIKFADEKSALTVLARVCENLGRVAEHIWTDPPTDKQIAPHGWIWLDDDGWEHNPNPQHPQARGEAEYGKEFRPATAAQAISPEFYRAPEVELKLVPTGGSHG